MKTDTPILSVSQLNTQVRQLLEGNFPLLLIEGEISNLRKPSSGHLYFSLKDEHAQVRCAMFRMRNNFLPFELRDGMHVLVQAKISLYEERGDFQLIVQNIEETGDGALRRAFELLKQRLAAEGLFDAEYKKPLPDFPTAVGVITSPTGAAIHDILQVLKRRFPALPVIIYPTPVQGNEAAAQIVAAIQQANERQECDVLIVARGGGSLEDLWPFNMEVVARAIFASAIPIVSGIGHEIDVTIADFAADHRAPTPSAAAELVSPQREEYLQKIQDYYGRLNYLMVVELRQATQSLQNLKTRLRHPQQILDQYKLRQENFFKRLTIAIQHELERQKQRLSAAMHALDTVSPLSTLQRGYTIVSKQEKVLQSIADVSIGDQLTTRFADGYFVSQVSEKREENA